MAQNDGVPGVAVTPLVGAAAVSPTNPLPVTGAGGSALPAGVTLGPQQQTSMGALAAGAQNVVPAVPGKRIFVTGYNFSLPAADTVFFTSNAALIGTKGVGVVGGNEAIGGEPYLFNTGAGEALNFNTTLAAASAGLQVRYRVEV